MKFWNKIGESILNGVFQGREYEGKLMNVTEILTQISRHCKRIEFDDFNPCIKGLYSNEFQSYHEDFSQEVFDDTYKMGIMGIYDGHQGFNSSHFLKETLIDDFMFHFQMNDGDIEKAFIDSFVECDNKLCAIEKLSGASAMMSVIRENKLYIGNTGLCRAVMGQKSDEGITDLQLTHDHNVAFDEERILRNFPDEDVIIGGKVKGILEHTRSFGDALFKSGGKLLSMMANLKDEWNPPYLSPKPEITVKDLIMGKDKFLILASGGLWSCMSNVEAVRVVAESLEKGEDPTVNIVAHVLSKNANCGKNFEQRLSSVLHTPEGFRKMLFPDITVKVVVFEEDDE